MWARKTHTTKHHFFYGSSTSKKVKKHKEASKSIDSLWKELTNRVKDFATKHWCNTIRYNHSKVGCWWVLSILYFFKHHYQSWRIVITIFIKLVITKNILHFKPSFRENFFKIFYRKSSVSFSWVQSWAETQLR